MQNAKHIYALLHVKLVCKLVFMYKHRKIYKQFTKICVQANTFMYVQLFIQIFSSDSHVQLVKFKISKMNDSQKSLLYKLQSYKHKTFGIRMERAMKLYDQNTFNESRWMNFIPAGFFVFAHTFNIWYSTKNKKQLCNILFKTFYIWFNSCFNSIRYSFVQMY